MREFYCMQRILCFFLVVINLLFVQTGKGQTMDTVPNYLDSVITYATNICSNEMDVADELLCRIEVLADEEKYPLELASIWRIKGLICFYKVNYAEALEYFIKSRDLFQQIRNNEGQARAIENIALVYDYQGLHEKALNLKLKALELRKNDSLNNNLHRSYNNIAVSYKELKDYKKALEYFIEALIYADSIDFKQSHNLYYNNVGSIYLQLGNYDSAFYYFTKSLSYSFAENDKQMEANTYHYLGNYYLKEQDKNKALEYYLKAFELFKELGIVYELSDIANSLQHAYALTGNFEKAYQMHVLYKQMADSSNMLKAIQRITSIEEKAAFEKEEKHTQYQHQLEMHHQKLINNIAIILVLASFAITAIFIRSNRRNKKFNKELSRQRNEIQQQNEEILSQHDKILHINQELEYQKKELQTHRQNTLDSLIYAEHIQSSLLPQPVLIQKHFADSFIFFQPKDIVSGDFYWVKNYENATLLAVSDCTGHGVPGAFMSVMGISFLNEIIQKANPKNPAAILDTLREKVKKTLNPDLKTNKSANYIDLYLSFKIKDGMDMALCYIDHERRTLTFAGANMPVIIVRKGKIIELKPNDNPVGVYLLESSFVNQTLPLEPGDMIYLFSDGYYDQYGGSKNRKFYLDPFKIFLLEISGESAAKQHSKIIETLAEWQGVNDQIDDITVIGLRI